MFKALNAVVKIDPKFTNDYWQLYASKSGYKTAVRMLNSELKKAVNAKGSTRLSVAQAMWPVFRELSVYGAEDTEPRDFFYEVLDHVYGK